MVVEEVDVLYLLYRILWDFWHPMKYPYILARLESRCRAYSICMTSRAREYRQQSAIKIQRPASSPHTINFLIVL
jgi:hypothetical protein